MSRNAAERTRLITIKKAAIVTHFNLKYALYKVKMSGNMSYCIYLNAR
jgi:hypothetical protein